MTRALPSDKVKKPNLNVNSTSLVLSACSYITEDPQCSSHIHNSINAITMCFKQINKSHNDQPQVKTQMVNKDGTPPHKGIKSPSKLLSSKYQSQSSLGEHNKNSTSPKRVHFINTITVLSKDDKPREKPTVKPGSKDDDRDTIVKIKEERHVDVEKAYIDLNSLLNIMTRMQYNWIMRKQLKPMEDPQRIRGISNFTGRIKGMHIFVGNFTYISDFMIIEDVSSIIDPRLSQISYEMPHKIEQYSSLSDLEKKHTKSVYLRNEDDKRRGVEYMMDNILGL
nr:retrotransposon Orf1 [Tanacetum cinerariifolium]